MTNMAQPDTIQDGNPINMAQPKAPRTYSTLNLSHPFYTTQAYGLIQPVECRELIKGDIFPYRHQMALRTYSMKAPLMSDMFVKKDSFLVYLQSILPNNWEKIVVEPNQGDDVNPYMNGFIYGSDLYAIVDRILSSYYSYFTVSQSKSDNSDELRIGPSDSRQVRDYLSTTVDGTVTYYEVLLKYFLLGELFFSDGSLLANLGHKFTWLYKWHETGRDSTTKVAKSFDELEQAVMECLAVAPSTDSTHVHSFKANFYSTFGGTPDTYVVVPELTTNDFGGNRTITFRHFLDLARQNLNFSITDLTSSISATPVNNLLFDYTGGIVDTNGDKSEILSADYWPDFNFNDVSSYQLACAHFYSNDHVDYIYSANLYRQLMWYYYVTFVQKSGYGPTSAYLGFTYNGVFTNYDALSGAVFNYLFAGFGTNSELDFYRKCYINALLSYRHSLRYVDYFTGARTQPLAIGNTEVTVNNNKVDVIDTIRVTNMARFLYWAQRTKRKVSSYLKGLFPGGAPAPDFHDPQFLSHTGDNIKNIENQNSAEAQMKDANSITSNLVSNSNHFEFQVTPDRPGYFIQLCYFDAPRAYCTVTDREKYHKDRYDMFNSFCQWNGSQPILCSENGTGLNSSPWAYTLNYMEYKQKPAVCAGGFVRYLPGFAFLADNNVGLPVANNLSPAYIRSWSTELDDFFVSLTGYTPASYFHFIIKHVALIQAKRPTAYAPDLI